MIDVVIFYVMVVLGTRPGKVMVTVFWDTARLLRVDFLDYGINTRTGKGLRITRPGKGGQILPLPAISASIRARITKLGKRKDTPVNLMVCNFGDLGSIF